MSDRRAAVARTAPLLLVVALGAAWLVPAVDGLALAPGTSAAARSWTDALDGLGDEAVVLVAFDPDLGTYAEIRPTVRTAVADLLWRDARLAFVSLTPEGRALFLAERGRLAATGVNPTRVADLGYLPGAEAAIAALAGGLPSAAGEGVLPRVLDEEGLSSIEAVLVVGGNDIGPRSWVEQFLPRIDAELPLLAITPTVLLPEVRPFVDSGQIDALLGTPRDGAAYRASASLERAERLAVDHEPRPLALLVGMLIAIAVLGQAWAARIGGGLRAAWRDGRGPS